MVTYCSFLVQTKVKALLILSVLKINKIFYRQKTLKDHVIMTF